MGRSDTRDWQTTSLLEKLETARKGKQWLFSQRSLRPAIYATTDDILGPFLGFIPSLIGLEELSRIRHPNSFLSFPICSSAQVKTFLSPVKPPKTRSCLFMSVSVRYRMIVHCNMDHFGSNRKSKSTKETLNCSVLIFPASQKNTQGALFFGWTAAENPPFRSCKKVIGLAFSIEFLPAVGGFTQDKAQVAILWLKHPPLDLGTFSRLDVGIVEAAFCLKSFVRSSRPRLSKPTSKPHEKKHLLDITRSH